MPSGTPRHLFASPGKKPAGMDQSANVGITSKTTRETRDTFSASLTGYLNNIRIIRFHFEARSPPPGIHPPWSDLASNLSTWRYLTPKSNRVTIAQRNPVRFLAITIRCISLVPS